MWIAAASGLYRAVDGGDFEKAPHSRGVARAVVEDDAGRVGRRLETGFRRGDTTDRNRLFEARDMSLFHDSRGGLWLTTIGQGLWLVRNGLDTGLTERQASHRTDRPRQRRKQSCLRRSRREHLGRLDPRLRTG